MVISWEIKADQWRDRLISEATEAHHWRDRESLVGSLSVVSVEKGLSVGRQGLIGGETGAHRWKARGSSMESQGLIGGETGAHQWGDLSASIFSHWIIVFNTS